jgi:hypothetical protein
MRILASTYGDNLSAMVTGEGFKVIATDVTESVNPFQYLSVQSEIPVNYYIFDAEIPYSSSYDVRVYDKSDKEYVTVIDTVPRNNNSCSIASQVINDPLGATVLAPIEPYFVETPVVTEPDALESDVDEYIDESLYEYSAPVVPQLLQNTILKPASEMPVIIPAPFVDESEDPQEYVEQYNNDKHFKNWFDESYPQYDSISQAVGLELESETKPLAPFVDPAVDPQHYIDRYNSEGSYREWFNDNYPEYDSISQAVGLEQKSETMEEDFLPELICGFGTEKVNGVCQVIVDEKPKADSQGKTCFLFWCW